MEINSKRDLRLVGRAVKDRWNVDRERVKEALMQCLSDPDLAVDAAKILIAADALDAKREELEEKQRAGIEQRKLQLLELAQRLPVRELAELASNHGIIDSTAKDDGGGG